MSTSCVDVCDAVIEVMCLKGPCPHYNNDCMPEDDRANHEQMVVCIGSLVLQDGHPGALDHPWNE